MFQDEWLLKNKPAIYWPMLQTAETVAQRYKMGREEQDRYGARRPAFAYLPVPATTLHVATSSPGTYALSMMYSSPSLSLSVHRSASHAPTTACRASSGPLVLSILTNRAPTFTPYPSNHPRPKQVRNFRGRRSAMLRKRRH